jgi:hypothetical protein
MTWQIVKKIGPPVAPLNWYPQIVEELVEGELTWPVRGHEYLPEAPVIYTFRHPLEAYLSLRSRFHTDVGRMVPGVTGEKKEIMGQLIPIIDAENKTLMTKETADYHAMVAVGSHWSVWQQFKADQQSGRDVLFLKYEDYFHDRMKRIDMIAEFMELQLSEEKKAEIFEYTALEKNATRSLDPRFTENEEVTFSHGYLEESGMQKGHINLELRGVPGAYFQAYPNFVTSVQVGMTPALQALKEMCEDMGYDL